MITYRIMVLLLLAGFTHRLCAQKAAPSFAEPFRLEVTTNKTTHLVFPGAIASVDRGSRDILVQKAEGVDHILRIKAAAESFEETNVSVITRDGQLFSFLVTYHPRPSLLTVAVVSLPGEGVPVAFKEKAGTAPPLSSKAGTAAGTPAAAPSKEKATIRKRARKHGMKATVTGLYVRDHSFYFRLQLKNGTSIPYPVDQLRFSLQDRREARRTASQEVELPFHLHAGEASHIAARSEETWVAALPAFTLPAGKCLQIALKEKSGGRHLTLQLRNRHLLRALPTGNELKTTIDHR